MCTVNWQSSGGAVLWSLKVASSSDKRLSSFNYCVHQPSSCQLLSVVSCQLSTALQSRYLVYFAGLRVIFIGVRHFGNRLACQHLTLRRALNSSQPLPSRVANRIPHRRLSVRGLVCRRRFDLPPSHGTTTIRKDA